MFTISEGKAHEGYKGQKEGIGRKSLQTRIKITWVKGPKRRRRVGGTSTVTL